MRETWIQTSNILSVDLDNIKQFVDAVKMDLDTLKNDLNDTKTVMELLAQPHEEQRKVIMSDMYKKGLVQELVSPLPEHLKDIYDFKKL